MAFVPQETELDKVLNMLPCLGGLATSVHSDPFYKELAAPIIQLGIAPILKNLPDGKYCIAGGVARSVFYRQCPSDVDIYLLGSESSVTEKLENIAAFYPNNPHLTKLRIGYPAEGVDKYISIYDIDVCGKYKIQLFGSSFKKRGTNKVYDFYTPEDVLATFDLVSSCFAVEVTITTPGPRHLGKDVETTGILAHPLCIKSIATKELIVNTFGEAFKKRMRADRLYKYVADYGFRVGSESEMKLLNTLLSSGGDASEFEYL